MTLLDGVCVVELSGGIASPYCTKLLADTGAVVVKVEPSGGDPARQWVDGALFEYLNTTKRSVTDAAGWIEDADILVVSDVERSHQLMRERQSHQVLVTITPFGCKGPWATRPSTEFTLQAAAGSLAVRGTPLTPPVQVGGRLGDYFAGTAGAVGGLASLIQARRTGVGAHVDVSIFECVHSAMSLTASLSCQFYDTPPPPTPLLRQIETPSIEPARDGYVVLTAVSGQQTSDFFALIGQAGLFDEHPEFVHMLERMTNRDLLLPLIRGYTMERSKDEILQVARAMRIPAGPVGDAATIPTVDHLVERGVFVANPSGRFEQPRVPYRISDHSPRPFTAAPEPGADDGMLKWPVGRTSAPEGGKHTGLPLEGIRVVDCTNIWAGPLAASILGGLGADVIKVEGPKRPDMMRFSGAHDPDEPDWYEWSSSYHGFNFSKRSITIDLDQPDGRGLFLDLARTADVLIENFTPRVFENFHLGWDELRAEVPGLVMVRMPAFGLDGPWRNQPGFAQTIEGVTGMASMTGWPDSDPILPRGFGDPYAAFLTLVPVLATLFERLDAAEGSKGRLIEVPMIEGALNVTAGQIAEYRVTGVVPTRNGNRGPYAAPQGVYPCQGEDSWVAIAVATDDQWAQFKKVMGAPKWAEKAEFDSHQSRNTHHDALDERIEEWTLSKLAEDAAGGCRTAGVPAEVVVPPRGMQDNPQMQARTFFEPVEHPIVGAYQLPTVPFRISGIERWANRCAPRLGEHNEEVLDELNVDQDRRDRLVDLQVIADRLLV